MNSRTQNAIAVATVAMFMGIAGCTDTTVEPTSTITETNIFNDAGSYRSFIAKVYSGLATSGQQGPAGRGDIQGIDEGFSQYLRLYWEAQELPTDEAVIGWGDVGLPEMNTQLWAASNSFVVSMYYRVFFQVGMANQFLRETEAGKLTGRSVSADVQAQIKTYRAEARFLRALSYWHGIDLFGNIPLVTEDDVLGSTPPQQSTRTDVYNFIVSELNEIKADLPARGPSSYGRATKGAAAMLLAKLYLNSQVYTGTPRFSEARAQAEEVIASGYTLDPSFRHMFQADNHTSPEIIFAITQDGVKTQTWGGMTFLIHAAVGGNMNASEFGIDGGWWGLRLKQQAYNLFEAADGRRSFAFTNGSVNVTNIGDFFTGVAYPKYTNRTSTGAAGSNATHPDTDFPMFRLADAMLIYAEAVVRGGGGTRAQALAYINQLRTRAFGGPAGNITDAQMTVDFILDERGRELMWEGHRRTDLIRYGKFTGGAYIWAWKGGTAAGTSTEAFRNLYPLPANELVANPNLVQNPGY